MKKKVIIRADGGASIGLGHLVRCTALADMLKIDFNIVFALQEPGSNVLKIVSSVANDVISLKPTDDFEREGTEFAKYIHFGDIVVVDGYNFQTNYQRKIKDKGGKLVAIDDLHAWHHVADVVINHAAGANPLLYLAEKYTRFYSGPDYVLLRKEFLHLGSHIKEIHSVKKVFISMGAVDIHNISYKFTEALIRIGGIEEVHLMVSTLNPNINLLEQVADKYNHPKIKMHFNIVAIELIQLLKLCDVIICPASSILFESCAVGIGIVSGYTADNQVDNLNGMEKQEILINFGNLAQLSSEEMEKRLYDVIKNPVLLNEQVKNQKKLIDGKSPERLLKIFKSL